MPDTIPCDAIDLWPAGQVPLARGHGLEDRPRITPFLLADGGQRPALIVLPGGGYGGRAVHEGEPVARWLNSLGLAAFVLDYRVAPYRHPAPLLDAQRAVRYVRHRSAEWRIDRRRLGILGFSAGGHLAASAATIFDAGDPSAVDPVQRQSCRPDCLVACYPVVTFTQHTHGGSMRNLLGEEADPELREMLCIEERVTARTPPVFIWHTAEDPAVPVQNSLMLADALARHRVDFELHVFPRGHHGMGLAMDDPVVGQWRSLCAAWLAKWGGRGEL